MKGCQELEDVVRGIDGRRGGHLEWIKCDIALGVIRREELQKDKRQEFVGEPAHSYMFCNVVARFGTVRLRES